MLGLDQPEFWVALGKIIWINVLLSGDNAVVIALACRSLPARTRTWGIVLGAGVAVLLRIIFTGIVTTLLNLQGLKIAGSLALLYIAVSLLIPNDDGDESEVEAAENLWRAVRIVAVADLVMSLDNVIAIAGAAKGSWLLIGIGLTTSVPLIIAGAAMITALFNRFPILVQAGAALLGWVAGEMMASDPALVGYLGDELAHGLEIPAAAVGAVLVLAVGAWITRRRARAHRHAAPQEISNPEMPRAPVNLGLKSDAVKEHASTAAAGGERKLR
jgi:YjbE family integral membrane protein